MGACIEEYGWLMDSGAERDESTEKTEGGLCFLERKAELKERMEAGALGGFGADLF